MEQKGKEEKNRQIDFLTEVDSTRVLQKVHGKQKVVCFEKYF